MKIFAKFVALLLFVNLCSCGKNPTAADIAAQENFDYSLAFLDVFFIFRDQLPDNPGQFSDAKTLYQSVDEPYTEYFNPDEAQAFLDLLDTKSIGLGVRFNSDGGEPYLIDEVIDDSPAQQAGLLAGDILRTIDGVSLQNLGLEEVSDLLDKPAGTTVELGVERNNGIITLTVTIGEFFSPSVTVNQFDDNITYIGLHVFLSATGTTGGTAAEFRTALQQTAGAQYTILDLRNNGGGETSHAIRIVSEFVASNTPIMDTEERVYDEAANQGRTITSQVVTQDGGLVIDRNFVVLVNGFTASAAELMVAALRTHRGDIKIVGETTFGKARGQVLSITPESGIAKVTSLLLTPIGGTSYDLVGIAPDVVVPAGQDALDIAVDTIYSTLSKTADATLSSRLRNLKSALHLAKSMKYTTPLNYQWSQ